MANKKILVAFVMVVALLALQVGAAFAAPAAQATTISGELQSVTQSTDTSGKPIFIVTVLDTTSGTTQTVQVSPQTAVTLGLVKDNGDGTYTINPIVPGTNVTIDSSMIYADPCVLPEGANQPVGAALTRFFCGGLGMDYTTLQNLHTEGFGYGEIAQACFMAQALGGDAAMCGDILMDKKNHDFSSLTLPNGETARNWGQLKKLVLDGYVKSVVNLGGVMSGRADSANPLPEQNGHGNSNGHGNGHKP